MANRIDLADQTAVVTGAAQDIAPRHHRALIIPLPSPAFVIP
jgi:hypothetical protein